MAARELVLTAMMMVAASTTVVFGLQSVNNVVNGIDIDREPPPVPTLVPTPAPLQFSSIPEPLPFIESGCLSWRVQPVYEQMGRSNPAVATRDGNVFYTQIDAPNAFTSTLLNVQRAYNSSDLRVGTLGPGWRHGLEARVLSPGRTGSRYDLILPDGRTVFHNLGVEYNGVCPRPPTNQTPTLVKFGSAGYVAVLIDGSIWHFDSIGRLTRMIDSSKQELSITYGFDGQILAATDPATGHELRFEHDERGRLVTVRDWLNPPREVHYAYDETGRLVRVRNRSGSVTQYVYDPVHGRLNTEIDPRGIQTIGIEYDDSGRAIRWCNAQGVITGSCGTAHFEVAESGLGVTTLEYPPSSFEPSVRPRSIYEFDGFHRAWRISEFAASSESPYVTVRTYDPRWNFTSSTSGGETPPLASAGTPLALNDPLRALLQPSPAPPSWISPTARLLPQGAEPVVTRDAAGRVIEVASAQAAWKLAYDDENRVVHMDVPLDIDSAALSSLHFTYDAAGNLIEVSNSEGLQVRLAYDERSLLIGWHSSRDGEETIRYDERGDIHEILRVSPNGDANRTVYQYDGRRRLRNVQHHATWPSTSDPVVLSVSYDEVGRRSVVRLAP